MDDFTTWLRQQIEADLSHWRGLAAAYLPNVEREGEVLYFEARERVEDCEAKLAILNTHEPWPGVDSGELCCTTCGDYPQVEYPCRTVRLLGSAYRHRLRYRPEWAPTSPLAP